MSDEGSTGWQKVYWLDRIAGAEGEGEEEELPEQYRGKTAKEIAAMHAALETKLGEQGTELGELRESVQQLTRHIEQMRPAPDTGNTPVSRYKKYADRLILETNKALPELVEEIKADVTDSLSSGMSARENRKQVVDQFMTDNPEMVKVKEIFGEIGDRIYRANPTADFNAILGEAKKRTATYLQELRKRGVIVGGEGSPDKNKGITTSGGRVRDTSPASGGEENEAPPGPDEAILNEIASIKTWRQKRNDFRRSSK